MNEAKSLIVSYVGDTPTKTLMIGEKQKNQEVTIINYLLGDEAEKIWNILNDRTKLEGSGK
ncbi:MAG: hypothetical protein R3Y12_04195 [Clostridia bacterium]